MCGCTASEIPPEGPAPVAAEQVETPTPEGEAVSTPELSVKVSLVKTKPPYQSSATRWLPGQALEFVFNLENTGEPLMPYPGVLVECSDERIKIENSYDQLYGLTKGGTQLKRTVTAGPDLAEGTVIELVVTVFKDGEVRGAPIGLATIELEVGRPLKK